MIKVYGCYCESVFYKKLYQHIKKTDTGRSLILIFILVEPYQAVIPLFFIITIISKMNSFSELYLDICLNY